MQNLVAFFVKNKQTVIRLFQLCYLLAIGFLVYAAQIMATPGYSYELVDVAKLAGTFAVIFFTLTVLPGIARRF